MRELSWDPPWLAIFFSLSHTFCPSLALPLLATPLATLGLAVFGLKISILSCVCPGGGLASSSSSLRSGAWEQQHQRQGDGREGEGQDFFGSRKRVGGWMRHATKTVTRTYDIVTRAVLPVGS
ncbi:hypothetical protein EDB81DRAFT_772693 [Dactylonectria macrodidyma]|uniref:Uncharacterized protein n=1 Tax=Dactylonectria macrodidyma TaxID=307937 RepID=A0A9P9FUZ5_9HYPO|nr:hypothetical protein EDB81DRAFT_772693 [Dactylonectria macrodidyma]